LLDEYPDLRLRVPLREWIYEPGLPASAPRAVSKTLNEIKQTAEAWQKQNFNHLRRAVWSAHELLYFLRSVPTDIGSERMRELDEIFHLTETTNAEILQQWLLMSIRNRYQPACLRLEQFLSEVGRKIYIKPLYEELVKTDDGRKVARRVYGKVRSSYHPISQVAIDNVVGSQSSSDFST